MKIYIGSDHNGYYIKNGLVEYLSNAGYDVIDVGNKELDKDDDFTDYAGDLANQLLATEGEEAKGILLCGSGQGMCIAANRFNGIRACLGYDQDAVKAGRNDSDCNVLCLAANKVDQEQANLLAETFINTAFAGAERFTRRIKAVDQLTA